MINLNASLPAAVTPASTEGAIALLVALTDPAKARSLIDGIVAEREKLEAAAGRLNNLQAERTALDRERATHEALVERHRQEHESRTAKLAAAQHLHGLAVAEHEAQVKRHHEECALFVSEKREHAGRLAELDRLRKLLVS
jgi:hypothetical protein